MALEGRAASQVTHDRIDAGLALPQTVQTSWSDRRTLACGWFWGDIGASQTRQDGVLSGTSDWHWTHVPICNTPYSAVHAWHALCTRLYTPGTQCVHRCTRLYTAVHVCHAVYTAVHSRTVYTAVHAWQAVCTAVHAWHAVYTTVHVWHAVYTAVHACHADSKIDTVIEWHLA